MPRALIPQSLTQQPRILTEAEPIQEVPITQSLNWGVLATGSIARRFATDLLFAEYGALLAVGSRSLESAQRFADEFGASRAYGSYDDLLADPDVDAVYVSPPNHLHAHWPIRCAEAGKHILLIAREHQRTDCSCFLAVLSLNGHQLGRRSIYAECSEQRERLLRFLAPIVGMAMSVPASKCGIESLDDIIPCLKSSTMLLAN